MVLNRLSLQNVYQMGYVVRDVEEAMGYFRQRFGVQTFRLLRRSEDISTAHAYVGDMMLELVQVSANGPEYFVEHRPEAPKIAVFHHNAYRVYDDAEWARIGDELAASGLKYYHSSHMDGALNVYFVDTRAEIGVHTEYVYLKGEALTMYDDVPRNDPA